MQEEVPEREGSLIEEVDTIRVKIKMEPQSLQVQIPPSWQINKLKCLLTTMIPKLEFGMIKLSYRKVQIPGKMTLDELLVGDIEREYLDSGLFEIQFSRKQNNPEEFQKYYANKIFPLLTSFKKSPFQPVLHPKYYTLMSELVQIQGQTLKNSLQSLVNLRQLLNIPNHNLQNQNQNQNLNNNNQQVEEAVPQGMGVFGPAPGNNANIFQRGGFFVFKIIQILLLWQLASVVFNYINGWHIFILVAIVVAYLCIDHFKKNKNNLNQQPQNKEGEESPVKNTLNNEESNPQQNVDGEQDCSVDQIQENDRPYSSLKAPKQVPKWVVTATQLTCLFGQSVISFIMSLFPNWTIQLHNNLFRNKFEKIDNLLEQWSSDLDKGQYCENQKKIDMVEPQEEEGKEVLIRESHEDEDLPKEQEGEVIEE